MAIPGQPRLLQAGPRLRLALLCALGCALSACGSTPSRPNIVLVSIDTLRADHLGSHGYGRDTSPHLDALAARSVRFDRAYAPTPWTLPSHVALFSGRHPHDAGILHFESAIPAEVPLLAEAMRAGGYRTAAFVDSAPDGLLGGDRGFARGFDSFRHAPHPNPSRYKYDVATTVSAGLDWLRAQEGAGPFFLFLHTKSVHTNPAQPELLAHNDAPYDSPEPFGSRYLPADGRRFDWHEPGKLGGVRYLGDTNQKLAEGTIDRSQFSAEQIDELIALYDGGIRYVDHHLGRLLAGLDEMGLADDTIIVVTADHGEAFLEHYFFLHKELFRPLLHVPLIVHDPRASGASVVSHPVALRDVAPTILELVGLPGLEEATGRALPLAGEDAAPRRLFSFYQFRSDHIYQGYALDDGRYRLIYHKHARWPEFRAELFDTLADPEEQRDIPGPPGRKEELLAEILTRLSERDDSGDDTIDLDQEALEHLRSLGYLQ